MFFLFSAPSGSRILLGLLGYSLVQQSTPLDRFQFDKTFNQIGNLLSKTTITDQFDEENEKYNRASLDDYELGRLLGQGCNAAVYEARLRSPSPPSSSFERCKNESDIEILSCQSSFKRCASENDIEILSCQSTLDRCASESDIEILSRQSSYVDICGNFDNNEEEQFNELNMSEASDILPGRTYLLLIEKEDIMIVCLNSSWSI